MIPKLNLVSSITALFLFFLPWIDIRCSGQRIGTQTGVQTIYAGGTTADGFEELEEQGKRQAKPTTSGELMRSCSWLVAIALLVVLLAVVIAVIQLRGGTQFRSESVGLLCGIALLLIAIQMLVGFPLESEFSRSLSEDLKSMSPADRAMMGQMAAWYEIRYLPAIFLELVALAVPAAISGNRVLDRWRRD